MASFWIQRQRGHGRVAQQQSPQLHKHTASKNSSTNTAAHSKAGTVSVRTVGYCLVGAMMVLFFSGLFCIVVWQESSSPSTTVYPPISDGTLRRRQTKITTPFDGPEDANIQTQILSFLNDPSKLHQINSTLQNWDWPLVHIVNTRFMQEQGQLETLGMARLHLFRTFCLPTMVHQSTQQFLWIIKTDPALSPFILEQLIQDLQPYPNIYLVASNVNFMIRDNHNGSIPHSWRDGAEIGDILRSRIYTGDPTRLYQAMLLKDRQVVLETRLDADDGLHKMYLQQIQEKALYQFGILPAEEGEQDDVIPPRWLYWCTRRHVEWHGGVQLSKPLNNSLVVRESTPDYYGSLLVIEHSKLCITPGITVGFGIGTLAEEVPIHAHDKLYHAIHSLAPEDACGYTKVGDCLELVEEFLLMAVRARTPTSAGMQRVDTEEDEDDSHDKNSTRKRPKVPRLSSIRKYLFWDLLHDDFFVFREQIQYTNRFILSHLVPIAKDNLRGQCTSDHSCKKETKEKLLRIIEENINAAGEGLPGS